jgi:hypothetical protein
MSAEKWMVANDIITFKVFSATDASILPKGWKKPTAFTFDGVVFYDGVNLIIFSDKAQKFKIKDVQTKHHEMMELQTWLDSIKGTTFVGYGSAKFDSKILVKNHSVSGDHVDLAEMVYDASEKHYGTHGRRYDIRQLAELNDYSQDSISHLSLIKKPLALMGEWRRGLAKNVLKTLAAEVQLIGQLYCQVIVHEELRIIDERTERPVFMSFANARNVEMYAKASKDVEEE